MSICLFVTNYEHQLVAPQVLHEYWMTLRDRVSAIDELGMATERLRVRLPDEPKPKVLHIIEPHEVCGASNAPCLSLYTLALF